MNQLSPAERHGVPEEHGSRRQTLLNNQAAKVLSLEETTQAQARWPDRDTRWARTWNQTTASHRRRAKARLIIKGFTDPDLLDIESHFPTLTRWGL